MTYQLLPAPATAVLRTGDGAFIPPDPNNRDWQQYQDWLAAGNAPLPAPAPVPATVIPAVAFFGRFTDAERIAVQAAVNASPQLGVGLVNGLASGQINLLDPAVKTWMGGLVAAGAITAARETAILAP